MNDVALFLVEHTPLVLFLTVSFVGTEGLIRAAGTDAEGIVVTQVGPP